MIQRAVSGVSIDASAFKIPEENAEPESASAYKNMEKSYKFMKLVWSAVKCLQVSSQSQLEHGKVQCNRFTVNLISVGPHFRQAVE